MLKKFYKIIKLFFLTKIDLKIKFKIICLILKTKKSKDIGTDNKGFLYIDDSIHEEAGFILCACCYLGDDPDSKIIDIFLKNGFNSNDFEYSSGDKYSGNDNLIKLRDDIYKLIVSKCSIGIIVVPLSSRKKLGEICIEAANIFIKKNNLTDKIEAVFIDEGMYLKKDILTIDNTDIKIYTEQDSKKLEVYKLLITVPTVYLFG